MVERVLIQAHAVVFNAGDQLHASTLFFLFDPTINRKFPMKSTGSLDLIRPSTARSLTCCPPADGGTSTPVAFPNATLARYMRDYFVSFTLHMDPNKYSYGQQAPHWPQFAESDSKVLSVEFESIDVDVDPDKNSRCALFQGAI